MKKKMIATLAAALMLSTASVMAAPVSPFADVSPKHWSYEAVTKLAQAGIVDGYGDGTFRGDRTMTRYEMAQIVGKAMYRSDKADAEQKAMIEKLSKEYADELQSMGVKVAGLEKSTAGVKDLKISQWFQTENTYGSVGNDTVHEYTLQYRLTLEKQVNPKLAMTTQLNTKTYWDNYSAGVMNGNTVRAFNNQVQDNSYLRQAFFTYKPDADTTIMGGKYAVWWAGGMLSDDYVRGIEIDGKLGKGLNYSLFHGRYNNDGGKLVVKANGVDTQWQALNDVRLTYASLSGKAGDFNLGAYYLGANHGLTYANNPAGLKSDAVAIVAGTASVDWQGINWSAGYAQNTKEDSDNKNYKFQAFKNISGTDVILQYWKQEANYNPPIENGDHMAWWWGQYGSGDGIKGYRVILGRDLGANVRGELFYGDYKQIKSDTKGKKYGWVMTFSY